MTATRRKEAAKEGIPNHGLASHWPCLNLILGPKSQNEATPEPQKFSS
ncbi:hypothetical protein CGCSCA5_v008939 [Colletotrichum siamense]|nr:hypothetical protein CGCSCA5_v008939 [Colletotrichum siamense]KAF4880367.1 hypothetical protein CGCSCA1_v000472 [Colletotrichum siamense]